MVASSNFLLGMGSMDQIPASNTAVFYSLLTTSAFHLRGADEKEIDTEPNLLGRNSRAKAFTYLRKAIRESPSGEHSQTTMSATLSLVTADVMEGSMSEYWIHLSGAREMAGTLPPGRLHTVFTFLTTLSNTTFFDPPRLPWNSSRRTINLYKTLPGTLPVR
ncbi:uncharacterized protein PAC_03341 [Phialocephala subalpina]|uniref:Uncharacterized protein n=1 Tax=Phialocephala subalpina TaxID=576137 RepID=A0A1L7WL52_9HELO|nr:uncharacterized protein PAC_03341 [Phialocephala subalpina]